MNKPAASALASSDDAAEGLWIGRITDKVLATFKDEETYTCAAGISPSGIVHFGNFRDVITSFAVAHELKARGKKVRLLFSWDEFDRFRKVPAGVDPSFSKYIGYPLAAVPDPAGEFPSYAKRFETEFENSMRELGITLDYRYQAKEYGSGRYADQIAFVLQNRLKVVDILLSFKSEKGNIKRGIDPETYRQSYYPLSVYSRFSGTDKTEVLSYDGGTKITYRCVTTDKTETIDFRGTPIVKLPWKVDWAMRWSAEQVHFEPGGKDHSTPGSSYDVSSALARQLFNREPPVFQGYEFVGIQGGRSKMSGSAGDAVSPGTLLQIYEPALLKWLYMRRAPTQSFNLAFDTEVYRQYDEFDREVAAMQGGKASPAQKKILGFSGVKEKAPDAAPVPFKQAVALGQITQWQPDKLQELARKTGLTYDDASVAERLPKARNWLITYNPDEIIQLRDTPNTAYFATLGEEDKTRIAQLRDFLGTNISSVTELEEKVYAIPKRDGMTEKDMKQAQRKFFKDVYGLLIGKDTGPRLSTFLWAVDREKVLGLLKI